MSEVVEVILYKAKVGVAEHQLTRAALAITPVLQEMAGFISRDFGVAKDGSYMDVLCWQDMPSAKAAAAKVTNIPLCGEFFDLVDQEQMQFNYFTKVA